MTGMRKLAIGRIIGMLLAVTSLTICLVALKLSWDANTRFEQAITARPMEAVLDLSQPGTVTVPFEQTCSFSHGEGIYLDLNDAETDKERAEILGRFSGSIVIHDLAGNEILNRGLSTSQASEMNGEVRLADLPTFAEGDYRATITVDTLGIAFPHSRQTIYARYELCGLEQMPVVVFGFISFCAGFVALVSGSTTLPGWWRHGIWKSVSPEEPPSEDSAAQKGDSTETDSSDSEPPRELFF
ncbi:MAG: hypothetical protein CME32_09590 [Gimesia sp.]|nr:hypothetical protein [Gimesia sp.]